MRRGVKREGVLAKRLSGEGAALCLVGRPLPGAGQAAQIGVAAANINGANLAEARESLGGRRCGGCGEEENVQVHVEFQVWVSLNLLQVMRGVLKVETMGLDLNGRSPCNKTPTFFPLVLDPTACNDEAIYPNTSAIPYRSP